MLYKLTDLTPTKTRMGLQSAGMIF